MDIPKLSANTLATAKICRLCESKDGPFLNIFGPDMDIAKKIENVVLITVNEYDDLPHKICYRCSAKLQDFEEFVHVCIRTQENLSKHVGKKFAQKNPNTRKIKFSWEAKLNENKISNEEYCDELIKKALELATGIKPPDEDLDKKMILKHNIRKSEIRLIRCNETNYPGIEKRSGKYYLVDLKKIPKRIIIKKPKVIKNIPVKNSTETKELESKMSDLKRLSSSTKIILTDVNSMPDKNQNSNKHSEGPSNNVTKKTIPDSFTTVRLSGVGPVYTCKKCDSVIVELKKVLDHKCVSFRNIKSSSVPVNKEPTVPPKPNSNEQLVSGKQQQSVTQVQIKRKPGPARHTIKSPQPEKVNDAVIDLDNEPDVPLKNNIISYDSNQQNPPRHFPVPAMNMPEFRMPSMGDCKVPNQFFGYQFPTNLFLVPSGNNTFALKAGPPIDMPQTPISIINKPQTVPIIDNQSPPEVVQNNKPTSDSILPDFNNSPSVNTEKTIINTSKRGRKPKAIIQQSSLLLPSSTTPALTIQKDSYSSPPPPVVKTKKSIPEVKAMIKAKKSIPEVKATINAKKSAPEVKAIIKIKQPEVKQTPAPYPIGLLCRKSAGESQNHSSSSSTKDTYPQYTILPPKTPGKIIISTLPSKKIPAPETQETVPAKKRKKQEETEPKSLPTREDNQHFFTYINLDSMLGPPSILPIEYVQESSISTTVRQNSEFIKKPSKTVVAKPVNNVVEEKPSEPYTCSICDLTFSREKKLIAHVRTHYQTMDDDD